jgi:hypothetical protein
VISKKNDHSGRFLVVGLPSTLCFDGTAEANTFVGNLGEISSVSNTSITI